MRGSTYNKKTRRGFPRLAVDCDGSRCLTAENRAFQVVAPGAHGDEVLGDRPGRSPILGSVMGHVRTDIWVGHLGRHLRHLTRGTRTGADDVTRRARGRYRAASVQENPLTLRRDTKVLVDCGADQGYLARVNAGCGVRGRRDEGLVADGTELTDCAQRTQGKRLPCVLEGHREDRAGTRHENHGKNQHCCDGVSSHAFPPFGLA